MSQPVYALNLFNVSNRDEYLAYVRRSAKEVQTHGGRVVALGKFREAVVGEIEPRAVLILVEWASRSAFDRNLGGANLFLQVEDSRCLLRNEYDKFCPMP